MLAKNIVFVNFQNNKNISKISNIYKKIKKNFFNKSDKLLMSFSNKYQYSFKSSEIKKYKKFKMVNVIGMGGSVLGAGAIYSFLKPKIRKSFFFFK